MEGHEIIAYEAVRRSPASPRELVQILFRHRRLIVISFLATLAGAAIAIALFGIRYKAETTILVKDNRQDDVVSANPSQPERLPQDDLAREREIDTEVALLKSRDLLQQVVQESGLLSSYQHSWKRWLGLRGNPDTEMAKAVRTLHHKLDVEPVSDSNLIQVTYSSRDPEQSLTVLRDLDKYYIAKHVAVYRPPQVVGFFAQQAEQFQKTLAGAEQKLASFDQTQDDADPGMQRGIALKNRSQFDADLKATEVAIAGTQRQDRALEEELQKTPSRLSTKRTLSDNEQLMADLKSNLQMLEDQRTVLLANYQPTYRPVQDVEKQIAQVKAAIARAQKAPLRETSTDRNPTYEMLESELAKNRADLQALNRKAVALAPVVRSYGQTALVSDKQDIERQNLVQAVSVAKQNYLLYLNKMEQARISSALDSQRILNVAVAEAPTLPSLPATSPLLLVFASAILAALVSVCSAFGADYLDPTFRTPDEVVRYLDVPVLAALPMTRTAARFALPSGNDAIPLTVEKSGSRKKSRFFWSHQNGD